MNHEPRKYTRIISVKWLLLSYLKLWRSILLAVLIGALLLGGYKMTTSTATRVDSTLVSENTAQIETNNKSISEFAKQIAENTQLIEDGQDEIEDLEDEVELKTQRIEDLKEYLSECQTTLEVLRGMTASTELTETELLSQISDCSSRIQTTNAQIYELSSGLRASQRELTQKKEEVEETLPLENQTMELELITLQMENANLQAELEPKPASRGLKSLLKYAIAGGFLGAALVACWMLAKLRLENRIHSESELRDCFGLYELGSVAVSHGKHHTRLDLLLEQKNGERREVDEDEAYRLMAARLQAISNGEERYLITGTVSSEALERVRTGLLTHLPAGYQIVVAADPLHSPETIVALKNARVLLAEEKDRSNLKEIATLVEQLEVGSAEIVGYVTL